jgi:hypothetical protein
LVVCIIAVVELVRKLIDLRIGQEMSWSDLIKVQRTVVDLPAMEHLRMDGRELGTLQGIVDSHH